MNKRDAQKQQSRNQILDAAGRRLRVEGLTGAAIGAVMADAGLTHGAFYVHFEDKDALLRAALVHALAENRQSWIGQPQPETWSQRLTRLAERYLSPAHRRQLAESCALAALSSEAAHGDEAFQQTYEQELLKSLSAVCECDFAEANAAQADEALAFMALIIGSLTLSRAVHSQVLADRLLQVGKTAVAKLTTIEE